MINIQHVYTAFVEVIYLDKVTNCGLHESTCGTMDDIAEHVCDVLVKHNFTSADICDANTGELLMVIERS